MAWLAFHYYIAERGALLLPAHIPAPHGGHMLDTGCGFALRWLAA
jgi:hypothetical protein